MISEFLLKGIDNFFNDKMQLKSDKPIFSKQTLKKDFSSVIKSKRDISLSRIAQNDKTASKSRLRIHHEDEKESKFSRGINAENQKSKSIIKPGYRDNSVNLNASEVKNIQRQTLMNKYKENAQQHLTSHSSYMPAKDHIQRERQSRLPIKTYKYQIS